MREPVTRGLCKRSHGLSYVSLISQNEQSVGRWSGALPMASGLVKRAVDRGDIFLVVANTVYVANASWSGIWHEV